jgi:catechol 2,3-dioxygenase-like lactoylglutathione lyase family enzyme
MAETYHVGRLIDHVHLRVSNFEVSKRFYRAVLTALGREVTFESDEAFASDELFFDKADDHVTRGLHLAFQAADKEMVARFHKAAIAAGGKDNGAPGPRDYHPGYYAAFVLDPDGNNIEAVIHADKVERSAASVELTPKG